MKAREICAMAAELVGGERERTHGDTRENGWRMAVMANAYLEIRRDPAAKLDAEDAFTLMELFKVARRHSGEFNPDDYIDGAGYAGCAGEVAAAHEAERQEFGPHSPLPPGGMAA